MEQPEFEAAATIRVLIADNNPETREKNRELLNKERDIDVVGVARTGREAIDLAQEGEPDVVVLDVNLTDINDLEITEAICRRVPFAQVIILAEEVDPNYMRRAMLAGARDFIVKPPMPDELRSAVYRAGSLAHEKRASSMRVLPRAVHTADTSAPQGGGRVILVYSPKGGAGTTTISANLALTLNNPQAKTILVDGNLQYGDVGVYLNETGYHSILDLTTRVNDLDPEIVASVTINHPASGIDIMIAPNRPEMAEKVTGEEFFKVIQFLRRQYSYIIIDTPSELGDITLAAFDSADLIVLVTTQEIPSIKNTRLFLTVADSLHIPRHQIIFVLNRYDKQVAISPERIADNLKQEVAVVVPVDGKTALRAENQGQPFVLDYKNEAISKAVYHLADIIRMRLDELVKTDQAQNKSQRQIG